MTDRDYMLRAIELAKKGWGHCNPNPAVGAVIVKDGKIIGEGYHRKYGALHAERDAFSRLTESAEGATIYVTLEPCCHYGKQPPCTEAIIEHKISKVVIGSRDPNPLVSGKGCAILRAHGIEVEEDFMRKECDALNPIFFHFIQKNTPYVIMKFAMTIDGKIATRTGASKWITGETARVHVHRARSRCSAIMAGIGTVLADDPMLNVRIPGEEAHQPVRIIVDSHLQIPLDSQLVKTARQYRTVVAYNDCTPKCTPGTGLRAQKNEPQTPSPELKKAGVELLHAPGENGQVDLRKITAWMAEQKLDSLFIEGGGRIHEAAVKAGIVNHVMAYIGPKIFGGQEAKTPVEGEGIALPSESRHLTFCGMTALGEDILLEYDVAEDIRQEEES